MSLTTLNARMFDVTGSIYKWTITDARGEDVRTGAILYSGVRSKYLNPLKTDTIEVYELDQQVAKKKGSWLIRNSSSRTITADNMAYVVDSEYHHIIGVRKYKGDRNLLVLDTILRDNQTD